MEKAEDRGFKSPRACTFFIKITLIIPIDNLNEGIKTVSDILKKLAIDESETSHIFVSGIFSGFGKKVKDGDRVAIFPKRMGLLYKWYFNKVEND